MIIQNYLIIIFSILILFYIIKWSTARNVDCITIAESYEYYIENRAFFIDVREQNEFKKGSLQIALNIPVCKLQKKIKHIPEDKVILTFCHSGARAYDAYNILRNHGFEVYVIEANVYDLIHFYKENYR
ncbi:MAG: rhodanese-like domain-containing protein [Candidatus Muiribacteriota bacterium]